MYYLEANHIVKQYASHRALDDVTVRVPRNGIYGLLGPNGAGKTTLIRIINQITAPDEGEVLIDGRPLHPSDVEHIGYLPEERGLYKKMKVGEQILYLAQLKGMSRQAAKESMNYWLGKFDIKGWEKKKIEELSKGMQQKIQFITTVMHNPQLLIFDEPFSGFDPVNANLLKREILEMRDKGTTGRVAKQRPLRDYRDTGCRPRPRLHPAQARPAHEQQRAHRAAHATMPDSRV